MKANTWRRRLNLRQNHRRTLFKMQARRGPVVCFVCGGALAEKDATVEHIVPRAHGGPDVMDNYGLSHAECNRKRGTAEVVAPKKRKKDP